MLLSTRAYEAYGLGLLVSVLTAFATIRIVSDRELPRRWVMLAGAGAGLAFYLHPMFIAVALPIIVERSQLVAVAGTTRTVNRICPDAIGSFFYWSSATIFRIEKSRW